MKARPTLLLAVLAMYLIGGVARAEVSTIDHQITLLMDPAARTLTVRDLMEIEGSGEVVMDLAASMVITEITVDGRTPARVRRGEKLRIDLGAAGLHKIDISYKGLLSRMTERSGGYGNAPLMASQTGSYLASNSAWHPIIQGVAASYQISMTLPAPQKAIVPGRLIEEQSQDGQYRAVIKSELPAQGIVLIAGPFVINEQQHGDITLRTYFVPGLKSLSTDYLQSTAGYIDHFSKAIGDYPFSSFSVVSGPLPVGLGFAGMTYIGEKVLRLPFIRFTSLGHEVLHNWWGVALKVNYLKGNWAEGLTTYMADYAFAKKRDQDKGKQIRTGWLRDYAALPPRRDRAVRSFTSRRHDAAQIIGYNKVAFIFHMLEGKIGKADFDKGIRNLWTRHKFSTADWSDIQAAFEQASSQDLDVFFRQWVDRSGAPGLVLSDIKKNGENLSFTLSQPGLSYALQVPIRLVTSKGEEMFQASIEGQASRVELPLSGHPISLIIDPDFDIFRRLNATETPPIFRDTTLHSDTAVIFVGSDPQMGQTSRKLASSMLDGPPRFIDNAQAPLASLGAVGKGPLLIIGPDNAVRQYLAANNLPATPSALAGQGSARAWAWRWTDSEKNQHPMLVVEAADNKALQALLRPLPHYGRQGYLIFSGAKVRENGFWPASSGPLAVSFN